MALKRLFPEQDTFIVDSKDLNFGQDEILELGYTEYGAGAARVLMQFNSTQFQRTLQAVTGSYKATLHFTISEASNLPVQFTLSAYALSQSWAEGLGRAGDDNPVGSTWNYTGKDTNEGHPIEWDIPGGGIGPASEGLDWEIFTEDLLSEINLDVTSFVQDWLESGNNGLLLKFKDETESEQYKANLSFYSKDTHTIYRPYLEISWDDSIYLHELEEGGDLYGVFPSNLREEYGTRDRVRVDLAVKDRYPKRIFTTGSLYYGPGYVLPSSSYWGIKDEYTAEMAVNFDEVATRISADGSGSFFILDTSNLEPKRYYRLLIQVEKNGQSVVVDNRSIFRVR